MRQECLTLLQDIKNETPELDTVCLILMTAITNSPALDEQTFDCHIDERVIGKVTSELLFRVQDRTNQGSLCRGEGYWLRFMSDCFAFFSSGQVVVLA